MAEPPPVSDDIQSLKNASRKLPKKLASIDRICDVSTEYGLGEDDLMALFDMVLSVPSLLSTREKQRLINSAFNPRSHLISSGVIMRILGLIGVAQVYQSNEKRTRKRRIIAPTLQISLLSYLTRSVAHFGHAGLDQLRRSLPLLFKYLSYEYVRPHIVRLICIALMHRRKTPNACALPKTHSDAVSIKRWQISYAFRLYVKFPADPSLLDLLAFISEKAPGVDLQEFCDSGSPLNMKSMRKYKGSSVCTSPLESKHEQLAQAVIGSLDRRSLDTSTLLDPGTLRDNKEIYVALALKGQMTLGKGADPSQYYKLLDARVNLSLRDDDMTKDELSKYCLLLASHLSIDHGVVALPLVQDYILFKFCQKPRDARDASQHNFVQRLKLVPFLRVEHARSLDTHFLKPMLDFIKQNPTAEHFGLPGLANQLIRLISMWHLQTTDSTELYKTRGSIYSRFWDFLETFPCKSIFLTCVILLDFLRKLDTSKISQYFDVLAILLPPLLVARLMLSSNSVVQSFICGHIALCKNYKYPQETLKQLQNSYIMDSVNLLWRDRAFHYVSDPQSPHRAFFLPPELISRLPKLPAFHSGTVTIDSVGGFFTSPAWAMLLALLVRKFEDENDCQVRHEGPVSRASVLNLVEEAADRKWLPLTFEEVKRDVLRGLDGMGFVGLADLLFNSLKALQYQRLSSDSSDTNAAT